MAVSPRDLRFEMSDLLEEETESKTSLDIDTLEPRRPGRETTSEHETLRRFHEPVIAYEGRHRYEPNFTWTKRAERKVVRKIDLRICCFMCLMFFAVQVDRGNIAQVLSIDMMQELNITAEQHRTGQTVYFLSFLLAELPSQLIGKALGTEVWVPLQLIAWGMVVGAQVGVDGPWSFWTTRCLIGIFEGGFVPSCVLYLSYFYTSHELPLRLSWFYASYRFISMVGTIMAYFIIHKSGLYSIPGWGWLSETEGALTFFVGCLAWLYLPPCPTETASKHRGEKGWFSVTEEKIMVNRIIRDDPSKGDMHYREALSLRQLWDSVCDYHMFPIYLLGLSWHISVFPVGQYFLQNLFSSGSSALEVGLKAIPSDILWTFNVLALTFLTEVFNERLLCSIFSQIWVLPNLVAMMYVDVVREMKDTYHLTMLVCAQPFVHAILLGLASRNSGSVRTRTVSLALYSMCVQASTLMGAYIYQLDERPFHFQGNKIFAVLAAWNIFLFVGTKWFYWYCNQCREFRWETMSRHDRQFYLANAKDQGNKRLDFRFKH